MSLSALPVTPVDLTTLQAGVQFFTNAGQASSQATVINTPGSGQSVFTYTASLLNSNIQLSQVAMAVGAIAESGTLAVGDAATPNTLTFFTTNFLPAQIAFGAAHGFNQTVYASEALGEALATSTSSMAAFNADWVTGLSDSAFVTAVSTATGIHASAISTWLSNWTTLLGNAAEARGATLGDAIGTALINPTSANLETVFSTPSSNGFTPNAVTGLVANALIDVAQGTYVTGVALGALPTHTPLQGELVPTGPTFDLTTGVDTLALNQSNSTVNGLFGGAGATWTPGDTITGAAGTTDQVFNITGNGTLGSINVTDLPTNKVSGVETLNVNANTAVGAVATEAVQGDFTATGPMGDWVGLTTLNVNSGGNLSFADNVTVDPTTAVNIMDTNLLGTTFGNALTVTGGSIITITENNFSENFGGIVVNGGTGTTHVSITQTETDTSLDGIVTITDVNGASTTAAGTITTVVLNGLSVGPTELGINTITDNALTHLSVWNSDSEQFGIPDTSDPPPGFTFPTGAQLVITDNLATPTATTLTLSLSNDGINPFPFGENAALAITDTNNEYSTVHLTVVSNSFVQFMDNGLVTLDTPTSGTGALVGEFTTAGDPLGTPSTFFDSVAAAVNFDFSGLNGPNNIEVNRGATFNADVYTLGNFGTDNGYFTGVSGNTTAQAFTITNTNPLNVATINFGSGAYNIFDPGAHGNFAYVNTAPNGAGLVSGLSATPNLAQWGAIFNSLAGDTLQFAKDPVQSILDGPAATTVLLGIQAGLANPAHSATFFSDAAGNTFVFDHADSNALSVTPADALVEFVGVPYSVATGSTLDVNHVIHLA